MFSVQTNSVKFSSMGLVSWERRQLVLSKTMGSRGLGRACSRGIVGKTFGISWACVALHQETGTFCFDNLLIALYTRLFINTVQCTS
jgi:hypothetical protein